MPVQHVCTSCVSSYSRVGFAKKHAYPDLWNLSGCFMQFLECRFCYSERDVAFLLNIFLCYDGS